MKHYIEQIFSEIKFCPRNISAQIMTIVVNRFIAVIIVIIILSVLNKYSIFYTLLYVTLYFILYVISCTSVVIHARQSFYFGIIASQRTLFILQQLEKTNLQTRESDLQRVEHDED